MNEGVKTVVENLHNMMEKMSIDERLEVINFIMEGFCPHCGSKYLPCYCMRDD